MTDIPKNYCICNVLNRQAACMCNKLSILKTTPHHSSSQCRGGSEVGGKRGKNEEEIQAGKMVVFLAMVQSILLSPFLVSICLLGSTQQLNCNSYIIGGIGLSRLCREWRLASLDKVTTILSPRGNLQGSSSPPHDEVWPGYIGNRIRLCIKSRLTF